VASAASPFSFCKNFVIVNKVIVPYDSWIVTMLRCLNLILFVSWLNCGHGCATFHVSGSLHTVHGDDEHEVGMLEYILKNGGGTFDAKTFEPVEPKDGYSVGIEFGSFKVLEIAPKFGDHLWDADIADVFKEIVEEFGVEHVGAWVNDGFVHLDPVEIYVGYKDAVLAGLANGQQEIYSFKDKKSINVLDAWDKILEEEGE